MKPAKIAIIGGGITGLACAWYLRHSNFPCELFLIDDHSRFGGMLQTDDIGGYLVERSADMFTTDPGDAIDLIRKLGKENQLIGTNPVANRAYLAVPASARYPTGLAPVPPGFSLMLPTDPQAVLDTEILDGEGQRRFLAERNVPRKQDGQDESLKSFAVRRFGRQVFDRLIQPLVSGIYTADPEKLSMQATMARFLQMEQHHGSLLAAAEAQLKTSDRLDKTISASDQAASGARYDLFRAPRLGMNQLIDWIVKELDACRQLLNTRVEDLKKTESGWQLGLTSGIENGSESRILDVDVVVMTTSPASAARLISGVATTNSRAIGLAETLRTIPAASCALVVFGLENAQLGRTFDGFGVVVPDYLKRKLVAASFSSNKFTGRAPEGRMLIRCFIGGALNPHLVGLPDEELFTIAFDQLDEWLNIQGQPELRRIYRWTDSMPQYHVGHLQRVEQLRKLTQAFEGLYLAGNGYNGVGVPVCVRGGSAAAEQIVDFFKKFNQKATQ